MSERPTCPTGKRCFNSERGAKCAHRHASFRIRVYACEVCCYLHVTNAEKRRGESDTRDVQEAQR